MLLNTGLKLFKISSLTTKKYSKIDFRRDTVMIDTPSISYKNEFQGHERSPIRESSDMFNDINMAKVGKHSNNLPSTYMDNQPLLDKINERKESLERTPISSARSRQISSFKDNYDLPS
jgi:hypothetical protein